MCFEEFCEFIEATPHPVLYTQYVADKLAENGFQEVTLGSKDPNPNKGFIRCGRRAIFAYNMKRRDELICIATHDDSPCLKLVKMGMDKIIYNQHCSSVEPYGYAKWISFPDRNLQISGEIVHSDSSFTTIKPIKNVGIIPALAIHMKSQMSFNPEFSIPSQFHVLTGSKTISEIINYDIKTKDRIDLVFNSGQPPELINGLLASPRIDNLGMSFCGFSAFLEACNDDSQDPSKQATQIFVSFDKEEIGNKGEGGACSPFLNSCLQQIFSSDEIMKCRLNSLIISADATHGDHPFYPDFADKAHKCILGKGPTLTESVPGFLSTDERGGTIITSIGKKCGVNIQTQHDLNSMSAGGTFGSAIAKLTHITTIDIGLPAYSMHSYRELMAYDDLISTRKLFAELYKNYSSYAD